MATSAHFFGTTGPNPYWIFEMKDHVLTRVMTLNDLAERYQEVTIRATKSEDRLCGILLQPMRDGTECTRQ